MESFSHYLPLFVIAAVVLLASGMLIGFQMSRFRAEARYVQILQQKESEWRGTADEEKRAALAKSRAVVGGHFSEQLAPYLPGFPFDPTEARFIGKPVDFIVFRGLAEGKVTGVAFVEVKSGTSRMNRNEVSVRDAIQSGRVEFFEYRVPHSLTNP